MKKGEKKYVQLCGELDFSLCLLTYFVNRAAKSDEVLLRDVQAPRDKTEENENNEAAQLTYFILPQSENEKMVSWVLLSLRNKLQ